MIFNNMTAVGGGKDYLMFYENEISNSDNLDDNWQEIIRPKNFKCEKILDLIHYWMPPVPDLQPVKKSINSNLRIACVVEDRLCEGLRFEGEILLLTPANWKEVIKYGDLDFLLMESIWDTASGHWHMGQCPGGPAREELLKIVNLARRLSIPTVFWNTKGHEYHEHYKEFASHFDFVFCADFIEAEKLRAEGVDAQVLLPCVQPAIYNPFKCYDLYNAVSFNILFDGLADLSKLRSELVLLDKIKNYGLSIIESQYRVFHRRLESMLEFEGCILGCVAEKQRITAMKYSNSYLTFDKTISTRTKQQWMSLEAAACRLPVLHFGHLADEDVRQDVVVACSDEAVILTEIERFKKDDLYREKIGHLGWRKTMRNHTFAHRIQQICRSIGVEHGWEEYPKASLITPTFRRDMLLRSFNNYEQQSYPNKELILVFNGKEVPSLDELGLEVSRDDVKISNVPGEMFAGACLNLGHLLSEGEYCFRFDDDDFYGQNYIMDMMLHARCIDAVFFAKPPSPICFEDAQDVYIRKTSHPLSIVTEKILKSSIQWAGGNSFCVKKSFWLKNSYDDNAYGAADSNFMFNLSNYSSNNFAIMDIFNLVAERRADLGTHTWKIKSEAIKNNSLCVLVNFDSIFC